MNLQVIFQSKNGAPLRSEWQDYCREPAPKDMTREQAETWARGWCGRLERREGCEFRFKIEDWGKA